MFACGSRGVPRPISYNRDNWNCDSASLGAARRYQDTACAGSWGTPLPRSYIPARSRIAVTSPPSAAVLHAAAASVQLAARTSDPHELAGWAAGGGGGGGVCCCRAVPEGVVVRRVVGDCCGVGDGGGGVVRSGTVGAAPVVPSESLAVRPPIAEIGWKSSTVGPPPRSAIAPSITATTPPAPINALRRGCFAPAAATARIAAVAPAVTAAAALG